MSANEPTTAETQGSVDITERDLPLHCPMARTPVWSMHPRVYLALNDAGVAKCPYCGTAYHYKGKPAKGH